MPKDTNGIDTNFTGYIEKEDNNHHFYINGDRMTLEQYRYLKQYAKANGVSPEQAIVDLAKRVEEARANNAPTPAPKPKFYNEAKEEITIDQHKALGALGVLKKDEYFDQDGQKQTRNKSTDSTTHLKGDDYITPQKTETKPPEIVQPWLNRQATPEQVQAAKDSLSGNGIDTIAVAENKFDIDGDSTLHSAAANADILGSENDTPDEKAAAAARTLAAIASGKVGTPKTNPDAFAQDTLSGGDNTDTLEDAKGQDTVNVNDLAAQELPEISDELAAELAQEYDDQLAKDKGESNPDAFAQGTEGTLEDADGVDTLEGTAGNDTIDSSTPNDQDGISDVETTPLSLDGYEVQGADNNASDAPEETATTAVRTPSDGISRIQKAADDLERENNSENAVQSLQDYIDALEAKNLATPYNVLAQPQLRNASEDKMLANAHGYDSNKYEGDKDKNFYDESMRTSSIAETAPFNAPAAGVFIPPKIQLLKDVFSKMRVVVPAIGGFLLGMATPALAAKIICTTALTPIVPFAAPIVGFVFGAGYNLRKDYVANKAADQSFKFRELLTDKKALGKAFGAGAVGAGASLLGGFAFGELFGEAACGATETVSPEPAPVVDAPMPEPEPEPPAAPEFNILTSEDIIDAGDLLDLQQNDMEFLDKLIEAGYANGVDSSIIDALRVQLEGGFDFIDSTASAEAMNVYNSMLEGAMDASSESGSSITSGEYTSILSSFMDKLTDPDIYKTDTAGVVDDSYLPSSIRESIINQAQTLRAAIS